MATDTLSDEQLADIRAMRDAGESAPEGEPEPEPAPEGEPEPEPEPDEPQAPAEPAPSDQDVEAAYKKIDTKADNYARSQLALLAETGAPWHACPLCMLPGFVLPADASDPSSVERKQAVDAYFGAGEPPLVEAPDRAICESCDGWGQVLSGARNELHRIVNCSVCQGLGWIQTGAVVAPIHGANNTANGHTPVVAAITPGEAPDVWGRPHGSRYYGVVPGMEE